MEHSTEVKELITALAKAQSAFPSAEKSAKNPKFGNKPYPTLDDILHAVSHTLAENSLVLSQFPDYDMESALMTVTTCLFHSSGQWLKSELRMPVLGSFISGGARAAVDCQSIVGASTYARKLGITSLLGIAGEVDDDGNAAAQVSQQAQQGSQSKRQGAPRQDEPPIPVNQEVVVEFKDFSSAARNGGLLLLGHGASSEMSKATAVEGKAQVVAALKHLKIEGKPTSGQWTHAIASIPKLIAERAQWDGNFVAQGTLYNGYLIPYKNWKAMVAPYTTPPLTGEAVNSLQISHLTKTTCDHILTMLEKDQFSGGEEESALDIEVPANPGMKVPGAFQ